MQHCFGILRGLCNELHLIVVNIYFGRAESQMITYKRFTAETAIRVSSTMLMIIYNIGAEEFRINYSLCRSSDKSNIINNCKVIDPKEAVIKHMLMKQGLDISNLSNSRPVSNLTFLSKTIERVMVARLKEHISEHSLWKSMQSA